MAEDVRAIPRWPGVVWTKLTGALEADVIRLLEANGKPKTAAHCVDVKRANEMLAARFDLDAGVSASAALLHDVSAVIKPQEMLAFARDMRWPLDDAEVQHPFLLHQRLSAVLAEDVFGITNAIVLSAIACHTTLKEAPSAQDMALFLADKLAWDQPGEPPFLQVVNAALDVSLEAACLAYIDYVLANGMVLLPHGWLLAARAWLALKAGRPLS